MTEINSWVTKERTKKGTTLHDRTAQWTVWKSVESFGRPISETGFMIISLRKRCFFLDSQHKCWQYLGLPLHLSLNWLNCWYFLKFIARKTGLNREIDWSLRNHGLPITLFWAEQSSIDICPRRKFIPLVDAKKLLYTILLRAISIIWILNSTYHTTYIIQIISLHTKWMIGVYQTKSYQILFAQLYIHEKNINHNTLINPIVMDSFAK